jgi:NitT/TauT family transport system substrate-binding protein
VILPRRRFLAVGATGLVAALLNSPRSAAAEPPPETTRITLLQSPAICEVAEQMAETFLLKTEGFTDVRYQKVGGSVAAFKALAAGEVDVGQLTSLGIVIRIDAADPVVILGGIHVGCFELFVTERVRSIRDLKGKTVAIPGLGTNQHAYVASIAAYVGLDARKDITWAVHRGAEAMQLLAEGKVDGFIGFPPEPQELRARKIGRVLVNTTTDRPWSQYFCCMVVANREWVRKHPVAAKRALRSILKSDAVCAADRERAARLMVDKGYTNDYELALRTLREMPYGRWREYDPESTVRFFALRLREAGMIKASPQKIIAQGTDWRFLNELKKELKG